MITEADFVETAYDGNGLWAKVSEDLYEKLEKFFPSIVIKIKTPHIDRGEWWVMVPCSEWVDVPADEGSMDIPPTPHIRGFIFAGYRGEYLVDAYQYIVVMDPELELPAGDQDEAES